MGCFKFIVGAVAVQLLFPDASRGEDWPQWRGSGRNGVFAETGLLDSFPDAGLAVCWRVPVGWGWSSPVVAGGRVYVHDSEVVRPKAKERLHCFRETTGDSLWTYEYDVAYPDWAFDPQQQIGPVATPIVEDGRVYTVGRMGHLVCFDASSGRVLWQKNLETEYRAEWAPGTPSPLIEDNLLILFIGAKPASCVIALNKNTGQEVWRSLDESLTYSSPIIVGSGGKRQLIVWTQESVTSLDPATGQTYWRQRLMTSGEYAVSTPVFYNNRLLIGGLMFELDPQKPASRILWPVSKAPSRRIFSNTSTALFQGDYLFSAKSSGELICVEASTGKQIWTTDKVTDLINGASIHLTANGDSVLLFTDKGELIRARLTSAGYNEISRVALLEPTFPFGSRNVAWSPPAFANGHVLARNSKELVRASLAAKP
jgi:outer membrane protein assembly factor BamB